MQRIETVCVILRFIRTINNNNNNNNNNAISFFLIYSSLYLEEYVCMCI